MLEDGIGGDHPRYIAININSHSIHIQYPSSINFVHLISMCSILRYFFRFLDSAEGLGS